MNRTDIRHALRQVVMHPRVTPGDAMFASRMTNLHQAGLDIMPEDRARLEATILKYAPAQEGEKQSD